MKVILLNHVAGLGQKGEVKEVSEGYFRNFLNPRKAAREATSTAIAHVNNQKAKANERLENMKESAESIKSKIDGKTIELTEKITNTGHLYAAISTKEVIEALEEQLKVKIPLKMVKIPRPIKDTGEHSIKVSLYKGISAEIKLNVIAE